MGSIASIAYGEPRFTSGINVVIKLDASRAAQFCAALPRPDLYYSLDAACDAVKKRVQFNILHLMSALKIDVIIASDSEFDRSQLSRGVRLSARADFDTVFASPEDVIIKKLEYFQLGGSEKHLRDIVGILKVQALQSTGLGMMGNSLRPNNIAGFLRGMPNVFQPGKSAGLNAAFHFTFHRPGAASGNGRDSGPEAQRE